jgi:large subunit ribosomal protein L32
MRHTRSHTANRRSHHALKSPALSKCSHCGASRRPHHMCLECGYYNGRMVMDLKAEKVKREARIKAKEERIKVETGNTNTEVPEPLEKETISTKDEHKMAREENLQTKRPPKKRESK